MGKNIITEFLNPVKLLKAYNFHKNQSKHVKSKEDLELMLYSKILKNDMLHYGYFDDVNIKPETISIEMIEQAQIRYAEVIIEQIMKQDKPILDVGCGMGGLSNMMLNKGFQVEALTPDNVQKNYINQKQPNLKLHHMKFEQLKTDKQFGTVINSESLQYINLNEAFQLVGQLLLPDGRWIITDYFRMNKSGVNKSGHMLNDFLQSIEKYDWKIAYEYDITPHCMPTLEFIYMYADRFLKPLAHFAGEKLKYKKAWLYSLTESFRGKINGKIDKELAAVDPKKFDDEKKYLLFVLEKK